MVEPRGPCGPQSPRDPGSDKAATYGTVTFHTNLEFARFRFQLELFQRKRLFGILTAAYTVSGTGRGKIPRWSVTAKIGFATDLSSVPRRLQSIVSKDRGIDASVIHDWLYAKGLYDRKTCDLIFLEILLATESWATSQLMYSAVRAGGWVPWRKYRKLEQREQDLKESA